MADWRRAATWTARTDSPPGAFGDSASRGQALASLDTVETGILVDATGAAILNHASHLPIMIEVLRIARDRPDAPWFLFHFQMAAHLELGQFDAAIEVLDDPAVPTTGSPTSSRSMAREWTFPRINSRASCVDQGRHDLGAPSPTSSPGSSQQISREDHEAVLGRAHGE